MACVTLSEYRTGVHGSSSSSVTMVTMRTITTITTVTTTTHSGAFAAPASPNLPAPQFLQSGIIHDGLWDVYNDHHMGICAEKCSSTYGIGREAQDHHATESYQRAASAWEKVIQRDTIWFDGTVIKRNNRGYILKADAILCKIAYGLLRGSNRR